MDVMRGGDQSSVAALAAADNSAGSSSGDANRGGGVNRGGEEARLVLPGTPDALPPIRQMVVEAAVRCGFSEEDVGKIELAVGEACTNIVEHAYRTPPLRLEIEVRCRQLDNGLEVTILDYSVINFPVDTVPEVDLDSYIGAARRRGLGLYIIRSFVDHIEHRFTYGQGNELRMVKYFA